VIFAILLAINQIMSAVLHSRPEVVVPKLEGKGLLDALQMASALDLSLQQEGIDFDESLPAGTVLRQHPPSGMQVRAGRSIRVVVSKGGEVKFTPVILGKMLAEAQSILSLEGLQMGGVSEAYSLEFPKGAVLTQNPSSGTIVTRGALVDVEISKGLPPAGLPLLPNFIGQSAQAVESWAKDVGAKVKTREDAKAVGVSGSVVKQYPVAGQPLLEDQDVSIVIVPLDSGGGRFTYKVPSDQGEVTVRIMARDSRGESKVYEGKHKGKETVEIPIGVNTTTRFRVYVEDILKEERVVEP
jgi:eukaryotic-like serine/threonine-protein kinase